MDDQWIKLNDVPTKIRTWGKKLNEPFEKKELVLVVTGNPGLTGFYIVFLTTLYTFLQAKTPIWLIGHSGHDEPDDESLQIPSLRHNKHLYDINGQINHKSEFIRKYIPSDVKIHLVGHSIGAHISLQLMKLDDITKRIHHCYLLFPTLEYMADSPNGKLYINLVSKRFRFIYKLLKFINWVPEIVRKSIIHVVFLIRSMPRELAEFALMYIRPSVISKIIYMADDEMEKVHEPNYALMEKNKERLTFYYSTTDGWAPVTHYERLVSRIPGVKAQITDKFDHSFVIKSSYEMGALLGEWIQENRP